jgi:hypothetical protein
VRLQSRLEGVLQQGRRPLDAQVKPPLRGS